LDKEKATVKSWRTRVLNPFYRLFFQESENGVWKLWMRRYQIYGDAREWGPLFEMKSEAFCDKGMNPRVRSYLEPSICEVQKSGPDWYLRHRRLWQ